MANSLNLGQLVSAQAATPGASDAYFDALLSYTLASAATQVLPVGIYWLLASTNIQPQYQTDSTGTNWVGYVASGNGCFIVSDGYNCRLTATAGASNIAKLMQKA